METIGVLTRDDFRFITQAERVIQSVIQPASTPECLSYRPYFDTAVAGYWRALAMPYHDTMEHLQGDLYVRKATLEYLASARYDEQLAVGIRCGRIGNSSLVFTAAVFRGQQCLVHGELVYVFADPVTQTSRPVPQALRQLFTGFEAGEAMFEVRTGNWAEQGVAAQALRHEVFAAELGMDPGLMTDAADATAVHALAHNRFGVPLSSGRLLQRAPGVAQIGRMATAATVRGAGLGAGVLQALLDVARARGDREVVLHAQVAAVDFYRRAGFSAVGAVFEEAGVQHQAMSRAL